MRRAIGWVLCVATGAGCDEGGPRGSDPWGLADDAAILESNPEARSATIHAPDGRDLVVMVVQEDGLAITGGDIVLGDAAALGVDFRAASIEGRLWPEAKVRWLDVDLSATVRARVLSAMAQWEAATPIRFAEIDAAQAGEYGHVAIRSVWKCSAGLGYPGAGSSYDIDLAMCDDPNVLHELGHAIGLFHEQSRSDRDQYIDIVWENIPDNERMQYDRYEERGEAGRDRGPYDYASIMHYPSRLALSTSKVKLRRKDGSLVERSTKLSAGDIAAVTAMYANPPAEPAITGSSCENRCEAINLIVLPDGRKCSCNASCKSWGDCCADYVSVCEGDGGDEPSGAGDGGTPGDGGDGGNGGDGGDDGDAGDAPSAPDDDDDCTDHCASSVPRPSGCYCDDVCVDNGDCCPGRVQACGSPSPAPAPDPGADTGCAGLCGTATSPDGTCFCDDSCWEYGDCCPDYAVTC